MVRDILFRAMDMHMTLTVKNIQCIRHNRTLFSNIDFSISSGELLQVIGNNGVGKSSLLRIVAGLLAPESGHIFWNNQLRSQSDFYQKAYYLGHFLAIKSELTVLENIFLSSKKINHDQKSIVEKWLLTPFLNSFCGMLSQGQLQRVALAKLQLSNALIWILDEPFSHLDTQGVLHLKALLSSHVKQGGLVLLSAHHDIELDVRQSTLNLLGDN